MIYYREEEHLVGARTGNEWFSALSPTQQHQAEEEFMMIQKELACDVYIARCKQRCNF